MARLSDIIEDFIKEMFDETDDDELEIQRNELANHFSCAPSQINYVLTTRFTVERGYYIESRRGGGGCIKIRKVEYEQYGSIAEVINEKIGNNITYNGALQIINAIKDEDVINEKEASIMKAAVNDRTIASCVENKNKLRADILKAMIMIVLS